MSNRHSTEDQQRIAAEYRALGMPATADSVLNPPRRYSRPAWQRRILRVISPSWRARERRVAEFTRLVALASRALEREQAGPQVEQARDGAR
ncbi:hypothetical protein QRX60_16920 [Amycolatopsis mongoliensis]|uniref:Uncharacterized protein n=1 Tax=Amycolatopsis mongoliensis TaxID=715475 RepID=A0A9Y2JVE1_9PSEU|nr:hypothetical protein [Amycolatopsis sp. 4-36]WIY05441.1 hypothetical protein QRX60_16920 [Amycolatopsis sp. 4-36]